MVCPAKCVTGSSERSFANTLRLRQMKIESSSSCSVDKLNNCIEQVSEWMSSNRLKLNPSKSEFLRCTTLRRRHLLDGSNFALADAEVLPADVIRNLGVYFDSCLTRTTHVSQLVRSCFINCVGSKPSVNSFRPQPPLSWSTASLSPGLTTATVYWRVCRFASWIGYNRCLSCCTSYIWPDTPSDHVT